MSPRITESIYPRLQQMMNEFGQDLEDYILRNLPKYTGATIKGKDEFETLWNAAQHDSVKKSFQQLLHDLKSI